MFCFLSVLFGLEIGAGASEKSGEEGFGGKTGLEGVVYLNGER